MDTGSLPFHIGHTLGLVGLSTPELVALCLCKHAHELDDARPRALELVRSMGNIVSLSDMSIDQIRQACGCTSFEAQRLLAWMELGRRAAQAGKGPSEQVVGPADVAALLSHLRTEKKEHFVVVMLDAKNALMKWSTIHIGTLTMSVVGPREVFREAIREGAAGVILAHNHPSGDVEPSPEDIAITQKLAEIGDMLDIVVWDHVIVGDRKYASLRQQGFFDPQRFQRPCTRDASIHGGGR